MASSTFERILDKTARIPGQVYICASHTGFVKVHDPEKGGHYPPLPDDFLCPRCVRWEDLCDKWIVTFSERDEDVVASTRCLLDKEHGRSHLCNDLDGRRFAWMDDDNQTFRQTLMPRTQPAARVVVHTRT